MAADFEMFAGAVTTPPRFATLASTLGPATLLGVGTALTTARSGTLSATLGPLTLLSTGAGACRRSARSSRRCGRSSWSPRARRAAATARCR